jgi:hypothetical protein
MSKKTKIILIVLAVLVTGLFIRFVIGGSEDDWICSDGEWVKHGVPLAPKPESPCSWLDNFNPLK